MPWQLPRVSWSRIATGRLLAFGAKPVAFFQGFVEELISSIQSEGRRLNDGQRTYSAMSSPDESEPEQFRLRDETTIDEIHLKDADEETQMEAMRSWFQGTLPRSCGGDPV